MMKTILSILLLLLSYNCFSQITYSKLYNTTGYSTSGLNIASIDSTKTSFYTRTKDANTGFYLYRQVLDIDYTGTLIDTNKIIIPNRNLYGLNKIIKSNNKLVFSGGIAFQNHAAAFIYFADTNYNLLNYKIYGDTIGTTYTFYSFDNACQLTSGDFLFAGEEHDTTKTDYDSDFLLLKTDSLGNKIWKKNYHFRMTDRAWFIEATPDGGAIVGGGGYHGASVQGTVRSYDPIVMKIDSAGNKQWQKNWGNPNLNDDWAVVQNSGDGNYVVGTAYAEFDTIMNDYNDFSERTINVIKLDTNGNEIWNKKYLKARCIRQIPKIRVLPNGNIVAVGNYLIMDENTAPHQYTRAWILMLDSNGDSLWSKEYTHYVSEGVENIIRDIRPTPDGGFITCGEFSDGLNGVSQSLWVMKLDSTGWYYGMGISEAKQVLNTLKVYPNPTSDFFAIDISSIDTNDDLTLILSNNELKDLESKNTKGENIVQFDISQYPSGLYFVRLLKGSELIGIGKIVKQ